MRLALVLLLALPAVAACSTDTFVNSDAGPEGSAGEAGTPDAPTVDGSPVEAAAPRAFQCNGDGGTCDVPRICCDSANGNNGNPPWAATVCQDRNAGGSATCADFLECNDDRDCSVEKPQCCAALADPTNPVNPVVTGSECKTTCVVGSEVRLCGSTQNGQTPNICSATEACKRLGTPSWLYGCQL